MLACLFSLDMNSNDFYVEMNFFMYLPKHFLIHINIQ